MQVQAKIPVIPLLSLPAIMDFPSCLTDYVTRHTNLLTPLCLTFSILVATLCLWIFITGLDCDMQTYLFWKMGPSVQKSLTGKVIWISGACSGIGEQLAYDLSKLGCKLILSGNLSTLDQVRSACLLRADGKLKPEDVLVLPACDIREMDQHESMVAAVVKHFAVIDILINNVGRSQRARFTEIEVQHDKEIFDINVFGQINLTRKVMNQFLKQGFGHFVITSSVAGKFGAPFSASYTASKHALIGYFDTIRCEGWSKGIRVTTICPGPVLTPLIERSIHTATFEEEVASSSQLKEGKMGVARCSELMIVAIANQLLESWIALKPILWFCFTCQYFPDLSKQ